MLTHTAGQTHQTPPIQADHSLHYGKVPHLVEESLPHEVAGSLHASPAINVIGFSHAPLSTQRNNTDSGFITVE